jgi:hypothetical protein
MAINFYNKSIFEVLLAGFTFYYLSSNNRKWRAAARLRVGLKAILE